VLFHTRDHIIKRIFRVGIGAVGVYADKLHAFGFELLGGLACYFIRPDYEWTVIAGEKDD
jgi:hypothetical protein